MTIGINLWPKIFVLAVVTTKFRIAFEAKSKTARLLTFLEIQALPSFWKCFESLPADIQELAQTKFKLWREHPFHSSLHFKEVRPGTWSVRVNQKYRALAQEENDLVVWYWIGTHDDYDAEL